jgi:outer membrane lipopolysaccharide assembly protein LptE/RlpB
LQENFSTQQVSIGTNNTIRAYQATDTISYQLQNAQGHVLVGPLSASSQQTINVVSNEVLENSNKLQQSKEALHSDVASKIILQLSSKHTTLALANIT